MTDCPEASPTRLERLSAKGLRLALVTIFLVFGYQKFTAIEAMGIAPLVSHSPVTSWLMVLGVRGASRVFGVCELSVGILLGYGLWRPWSIATIAGAAASCGVFLTTLSFLLTTPGVFASESPPILSGEVGLFLLKDLVLLATSVVLLAQSLASRASSRTPHAQRERSTPTIISGPGLTR